jgi:hypothetical protein
MPLKSYNKDININFHTIQPPPVRLSKLFERFSGNGTHIVLYIVLGSRPDEVKF